MDDFDYQGSYVDHPAEPPDWSHSAVAPRDDEQRDPKPENGPAPKRKGSAADYPFDPRLRVEMQVGLDKLRCVPDRELAQVMYELHVALEPKWKSPEAKKWREEDARNREDQELERLLGLAARAFKGEFGEPAKQLAEHVLLAESGYGRRERRTDLPSLREFDVEFRKLRKLRVVR
jgi:hypothetical protein